MTSSVGQDEPGAQAGEQQIQPIASGKQGKDNGLQDQASIRPKVLPHFIHTHDDAADNSANLNDSKRMIHQVSLETTAESIENTESSGALDDEESTDESDGVVDAAEGDKKKRGKKRKAGKIDRSTLRKGKWTVEEEEYTSRIIHHFSTGLLTLPEGTTLRSYLAEKLACDPMRITKKFAGASCLGKRVFHLCDQTKATVGDIEMAKVELAQLEHRFRLRIHHGQSGVPLPPPVMPMNPNPPPIRYAAAAGHPAPAAVAASWLQTLASQMGVQAPGTGHFVPPHPQYQVGAPAPWSFVTAAPQPAAPHSQPTSLSSIQTATNDAIHMAWAQAAASLTPALSQLAAANLQQHQRQLQQAYETQLQTYGQSVPQQVAPMQHYIQSSLTPAPAPIVFAAPVPAQHLTPVPFTMALPPPIPLPIPTQSFLQPSPHPTHPPPIVAKPAAVPIQPRPVQVEPSAQVVAPVAQRNPDSQETSTSRTKDEVDAGSMLIGFLNSLHKGFLEAKSLKDKDEREMAARELAWSNKVAATAIMGDSHDSSSGRTSQPADSSPEDSQSELGGKDPSSSEESDATMERPRAPPRKRHKVRVSEFTSRNVAAHTTRMDALHHGGQHQIEPFSVPHSKGGDHKSKP
ncbi:hypothetical protein MHU86_11981 [Fragilaria crotonensis]|nr:hypothetical protein MHU86_11981 [Fragilaria crotonensis]